MGTFSGKTVYANQYPYSASVYADHVNQLGLCQIDVPQRIVCPRAWVTVGIAVIRCHGEVREINFDYGCGPAPIGFV